MHCRITGTGNGEGERRKERQDDELHRSEGRPGHEHRCRDPTFTVLPEVISDGGREPEEEHKSDREQSAAAITWLRFESR